MIEAAKLMVEVGADTADAERDLKGVDKTLKNMTRDLTRTGGMLTGAISLPLLGIAAAAVDSAGGFEQSMNILQQVAGASESAMASLQEQALTLGADTVFSAGEAAEAMLELAKAGMDTESVMASIGGVMDLAAAGGIGLAEAASVTASTLNAFGLAASESTRIADLLAATANASAADISDLSQGMKQAGFAFRLADQPVENLAASLAILTNVGLTGSDAGTALKNAFTRMINPTNEAADLMNSLGISFYDAQGNMRQLPDIIDIINTATASLTNQQRDAALATIFLSDGMKSMIPLLNVGGDGFKAMVTEVTKVGAATDVADARMSGFRGGLEYLSGSVDSFLIGSALPFLDTLGGLARGAGDLVSAFGALPQPVIDSTLAFLGVMAAAGPLMLVMAGVATAITAVSWPMIALAVGAALLAAAWAGNWGDIQTKTSDAVALITPEIDKLVTKVGEFGTAVGTAFANTKFPSVNDLWADFKAGDFQTLASTMRSTTFDLMVNLDAELNITAKATDLKQKLIGVVNGLGTAIAGLDISGAKANLNGLRDNLISGLSAALNGISWTEGSNVFAGLVDKATAAVKGLDFSGIDWAQILKARLLGPLAPAVMGIEWAVSSTEFAGLKTSVRGAISAIDWSELGTSFVGLGTAIGGQLTLIGQDMASDIGVLFAGLKLPELPKLPKITFEGAFTGATDLISGMTNAINSQNWTAIGSGFVTTITSGVTNAFANAGAFIVGAPAWIVSADQAFNQWLLTASNNLSASMGAWLANTASDISLAFRASGLSAAFADLGTALDSALTGFITGAKISITNTFASAFTGLGAKVSNLWSTFTLNLPKLNWADFVTKLTEWTSFVSSLSWDSFVSSLGWSTFISSLSWSTFVSSLSWRSFVPSILWSSFVPEISWGSFIPSLDWGRFISALTGGGGSSSSGQSSGGYSSGNVVQDSVDFNAAGTSYFGGGMTWVGERGPELVNLPRGSRIYNNQDSMQMAGSGVTINVNVASLNSDMDIEALANRLARKFQQKAR